MHDMVDHVLTLVAQVLLGLARIDRIGALLDWGLLVLCDIRDRSVKVGSVLPTFSGEELPVKVTVVDSVSAVLAFSDHGVQTECDVADLYGHPLRSMPRGGQGGLTSAHAVNAVSGILLSLPAANAA
jgi:hypothetical protein